ncbi:hypothetical protein ACFQBY_04230 [Promicromonospora citrea]|uniref:Uncharacterized protein n=1 Tax=Promicromonospora citrea TaxID=43677 RepID=A0A8H9GJY2_9MICO|nr:hypothetical protein [Promicromonospora citrea]NNH51209.1 hypothetical protein [Promicromonospora citrea]GGM25882.1 hypothetical protein GCM10010102_21950 [Promicromonospora citrea]
MTGPSAPTPDPSAVPDRVASTETSAVHEARPSSWTTGPFPPLWAAVIGSLFVVATTGMGLAVTFVGSVVSAIVARRRPWVSATAVVLAVWSGTGVLLTGRF